MSSGGKREMYFSVLLRRSVGKGGEGIDDRDVQRSGFNMEGRDR